MTLSAILPMLTTSIVSLHLWVATQLQGNQLLGPDPWVLLDPRTKASQFLALPNSETRTQTFERGSTISALRTKKQILEGSRSIFSSLLSINAPIFNMRQLHVRFQDPCKPSRHVRTPDPTLQAMPHLYFRTDIRRDIDHATACRIPGTRSFLVNSEGDGVYEPNVPQMHQPGMGMPFLNMPVNASSSALQSSCSDLLRCH